MIYGYARVSAKIQLKGNSLDEQRAELLKIGFEEIIEEQYTGTTTSRPKFEELLSRLKSGDTLVVCKLDRFARSVPEGINKIQELFEQGVRVHILDVGLLENTAMGNFFITVLLAVAALERCTILERTAAGKAIARSRPGFKEGRPPVPKERITLAMSLLDANTHTYKEVAEMTGISTATLGRYRQKQREQKAYKQEKFNQ